MSRWGKVDERAPAPPWTTMAASRRVEFHRNQTPNKCSPQGVGERLGTPPSALVPEQLSLNHHFSSNV